MRPHVQFAFSVIFALCAYTAVAADEPRLRPSDVRRAADAAARQHADLKSYTRGEPLYDPVSKIWGVNYRSKSSSPAPAGEGLLSVSIDDATGFASTKFSLATPTPAPPTQPPSRVEAMFFIIYIAGGVVLAFVPFDRKHTRSSWARLTFLLTAVILLFVGISELLRHYHIWTLSAQIEHAFLIRSPFFAASCSASCSHLAFQASLLGVKYRVDKRPNQALKRTAARHVHLSDY